MTEEFPRNELEECLALAAATGDHPKLLRALARNVVCIAQPGPGPPPGMPEIRRYAVGERPVPVHAGRDGRGHVLAFTSSAELDLWYRDPELVWSMVPAGSLASDWPEGAPLLLNAGSEHNVVLEPEDVHTVALLFAGANVPEAFEPGPATAVRTSAPDEEPEGLLDPLLRMAERHGEVQALHWGLLKLDEPEARPWLVVGIRFADGSDYPPLMAEAGAEWERASSEFLDLRPLLASQPMGPIEHWLLEEARVHPVA